MLKPMHRLRSKDEDESGTDIAEVAAEDQDETDLPDEELDDVGDEEGGEDEAAEEEGLVVTLGDEPEEDDDKKAPSWVTQLRKSDREKSKKIRELEEKLSGSAAPVADEIGKEPELEDFDYDADQFDGKEGQGRSAERAGSQATGSHSQGMAVCPRDLRQRKGPLPKGKDGRGRRRGCIYSERPASGDAHGHGRRLRDSGGRAGVES